MCLLCVFALLCFVCVVVVAVLISLPAYLLFLLGETPFRWQKVQKVIEEQNGREDHKDIGPSQVKGIRVGGHGRVILLHMIMYTSRWVVEHSSS